MAERPTRNRCPDSTSCAGGSAVHCRDGDQKRHRARGIDDKFDVSFQEPMKARLTAARLKIGENSYGHPSVAYIASPPFSIAYLGGETEVRSTDWPELLAFHSDFASWR